MADIIDLVSRFKQGGNLIGSHPFEFRKGDWLAGSAVSCTREESERFETHRREAVQEPPRPFISLVPHCFTLDGGYHCTVSSLYRYREDETLMRRLYRLAGLMECITKAYSPILRTDLIRRFFKIITDEREKLKVSWKASVDHFLLPIRPEHRDIEAFLENIQNAGSLKDLLSLIEDETNLQFDTLSRHYVFYVPRSFYGK